MSFAEFVTRFGEAGVYGFLPHLKNRAVAQNLLQSITTEAKQEVSKAYEDENLLIHASIGGNGSDGRLLPSTILVRKFSLPQIHLTRFKGSIWDSHKP